MNSRIIQEAADVMRTEFWKLFIKKVMEEKDYSEARYHDDISEQSQWIRHAILQGKIKAYEKVLRLPDEILTEAKEGKPAQAAP